MILIDTGPLVALFDRTDRDHKQCGERLATLREPFKTTVPVLTEAFHMLGPDTANAHGLMAFIANRGADLWHFDDDAMLRAFELMQQYSDQPMDLADASLVVAAEALDARRIFTLDRADFSTYRIRRGHRLVAFELA